MTPLTIFLSDRDEWAIRQVAERSGRTPEEVVSKWVERMCRGEFKSNITARDEYTDGIGPRTPPPEWG